MEFTALQATVPPTLTAPSKYEQSFFNVGDKVLAYCKEPDPAVRRKKNAPPEKLPAKVKKDNMNGTLNLVFDHGYSDSSVPVADVFNEDGSVVNNYAFS